MNEELSELKAMNWIQKCKIDQLEARIADLESCCKVIANRNDLSLDQCRTVARTAVYGDEKQ